jgi:hypothetical protein
MRVLRNCLIWLALYAILAIAITWAVERRIGAREPAIAAGVIGGFFAWLSLGYLAKVGSKFAELWLLWRGMNGAEPTDGARFAAIGPITPLGSAVTSPLTRTPAVAYAYTILSGTQEKWEGVALVPSAIRTGAQSIKLLALPELDFKKERITGEAALRNAAEYIRTTEFKVPDAANIRAAFKDFREVYADDDGAVRQDIGRRVDVPALHNVFMVEQVLKPGQEVCAFGRYSAQRSALVVDPAAPLHAVRIVKSAPSALIAGRAWAMVTNLIAALITLAIVVLALTALYAIVPLDVVMQPSWTEIRIEKILDEHVRPRIATYASMLPVNMELGSFLSAGDARGRIKAGNGELPITRAGAEPGDETIEVALFSGDKIVVIMTMDRAGRLLATKLLSKTVQVPPSDFVSRLIGDELVGRVSWSDGGLHAVFRVKI